MAFYVLGKFGLQPVHRPADRSGVAYQQRARRSRCHAAAIAVEQRGTDGAFQGADAGAGRGQCEMCARRPVRDAAGVGHADDEVQVDQVHG